MPKQLLKNIVRVQFCDNNFNAVHVRTFNLVDEEHRREMGKLCAEWQAAAVGNRVVSTVIEIVRAK